jgi:carotenoid 1,2-hydratase
MIGSVFSPYYAWSGRKDPKNHVAFNVGLYGAGVKRWTMTERGRRALHQEKHRLSIGPSSLTWDGTRLRIDIEEWSAPLPRKVAGTIYITPSSITQATHALDKNGQHFWHPIAASARADFDFDSPNLHWKGDAYLDSNWGAEPLEAGFQSWDWCRASLADGAGIYYDAILKNGDAQRLALRYDSAGQAHEIPCPPATSLKDGPIWRVARSVPAEAKSHVKTLKMLEDTPFYTRSRIQADFAGESATAIHESLDLRRFSAPWVRGLLPFRMPRRAG